MTHDRSSLPTPIYKQRKFLIILAIFAVAYAGFTMASDILKNEQKNFICSKKTGKKPPNHIANYTFIEKGIFDKICITSIKKKRRLKADCGAIISAMVQKGFDCKRTRLDLN